MMRLNLIAHSCKITNEKVEMRKKLVKHSEHLQQVKEECNAEKRKCEELKKMLIHKQQQCKVLQSIIDSQFCTDLVQFNGIICAYVLCFDSSSEIANLFRYLFFQIQILVLMANKRYL